MTGPRLEVRSEIGRLREVLVHSPGAEVDHMPPSLMRELLFDDIIYGVRARAEHRRFTALLEAFGVRVHDVHSLLREALAAAPEARPNLLEELCRLEGLPAETRDELAERSPRDLADALVHGLLEPPERMHPDDLFRLVPVPNLLFSRDAQVVVGDGIVVGAMSRRARRREPLLSRYIFRHHPELGGARVHADFLAPPGRDGLRGVPSTLEGGDVLILEEGVVLTGVSERTMERAVDRLTAALRSVEGLHTHILVPMPRTRSAMHLDTIFTRVSREECLVYAPMILEGHPETLSALRIDLRRPDDWGVRHPSLLDALHKSGVDLEPIPCGGATDWIRQAREQWTDGANTFAVAPGVVFLYERNQGTAAELDRRGYRVLAVEDLAPETGPGGRAPRDPGERTAILLAGEELSRARGGPRCMTMPLVRDPV